MRSVSFYDAPNVLNGNGFLIRASLHAAHHRSFDACPLGVFLLAAEIFEHLVHLLEGPAVRLGNEEEGPNEGQKTKDGEKCIRSESRVLYQWRGDEANDEVIEPVGASGEGHSLCAQGGGEDFGWHCPGHGTPRCTKC